MRILLLNSHGKAMTNVDNTPDIQILELGGGDHKSFHALLGDIPTPIERETLQLRAVVRKQYEGGIINLGPLKACMFQLGTSCDQMLDVNAAELYTELNIKMSELVTVLCYEAFTMAG